jgi:hypothetical protein
MNAKVRILDGKGWSNKAINISSSNSRRTNLLDRSCCSRKKGGCSRANNGTRNQNPLAYEKEKEVGMKMSRFTLSLRTLVKSYLGLVPIMNKNKRRKDGHHFPNGRLQRVHGGYQVEGGVLDM